MLHKHLLPVIAFVILVLSSCESIGQPNAKQQPDAQAIQVLQFHLEHRCVSCLKIEKLTRETLKANFSAIPFRLVNVEDKANKKLAAEFEASGTALYLFNPATGKKKNLTAPAFLNVGNDAKFQSELKKQIEDFLKG